MPIPKFLDSGLLPEGIHIVEIIDEFESELAWNDHRKGLVAGLRKVITAELTLCAFGLDLYVDGSFVTNKPVPDDIDVCIRVPLADFDSRGTLVDLILRDGGREGRIRKQYGIDVNISLDWVDTRDCVSYFQGMKPREAFARKLEPFTRKGIVKVQKWASG